MNMIEAQQFSNIQVLSQDEIAEVSGANVPAALITATYVVVGSLTGALLLGAACGVAYYGWQYYNS